MHIVAIAWIFVVVLMALAEATSPQGTVLGAGVTLLLYGALPLWVVMYLLGTPSRRAARQRREAGESAAQPDGGSVPAGDPVAPVREEA